MLMWVPSDDSFMARQEKVIADLSQVSRRDLMKTLGPAAFIGLAGCTGRSGEQTTEGNQTSTDQEDETEAPGGQSSSGGKRGGTLKAGMKVGIETMDGRSVTGLQSFQIFYNIYSKLLRYTQEDGKLKLVGDLAKSWEWEDDTTLVINLHEDAVFHNGEPVTANDVKYTFSSMYEKPEYTASLLFPREVTVEARDEHTAVFNTGEKPFASLESNLGFVVGIINEKADKNGDMSRKPIGSGPFQFEEWVDGDHVYISRFNDYWKTDAEGTQLPYLDRIEFTIYPEVQTKLTNLQQGGLDWIDLVPRKDVKKVRNNDSLVTMESGPGAFMGIMQFNTTQPPFSDPNIRKAALHAINWEAIMQIAFHGVGQIGTNNPLPPSSGWDLNVDNPYSGTNVEKAKSLIEQSEVDHTIKFTNYVTRGDEVRIKMQELIQSMLKSDLGMNPEIRIVEGSITFEKLSNNDFGYSISGFNGMFDPDQIFSVNLKDGAFFNYGGYANDTVEDLLKKGRQTLDKQQRVEIYTQIKEQYTNDAAKYYPYWDNAVYAMQPSVKNYHPLIDQEWWFEQVWLDK